MRAESHIADGDSAVPPLGRNWARSTTVG